MNPSLLFTSTSALASVAAGAASAIIQQRGKGKAEEASRIAKEKSDQAVTWAIEEAWDEDEWKSHPKSYMIKWMMDRANIGIEKLSVYLGCKPQSLRNKLFRDSFSIDDLIATSYACGFTVVMLENEAADRGDQFFVVDPESYFEQSSPEGLDRLKAGDEKEMAEKEARYRKLMSELEEMRSELGIEE